MCLLIKVEELNLCHYCQEAMSEDEVRVYSSYCKACREELEDMDEFFKEISAGEMVIEDLPF